MKLLTIQYVNFWKDPFNDRWLFYFIKENFKDYNVVEVKNKKKCDILICSVFGNILKVTSFNSKLKLFYTGENLAKFPKYNNIDILKKYFDLIVGFHPNCLEQKTIRFPLWFMYYPFYKMTNDKNNIVDYIEEQRNKNLKKNKIYFSSCICRHSSLGIRKNICDKIENLGKEIIYAGSWRQNFRIGPRAIHKVNFLTNVKYNICPENSKSPLYHTEKIFHALEAGCVPIYWAIDLPEKNLLNPNCYQFIDIENPNIADKQIIDVLNNYDKYINSEIFLTGAKDIIDKYYKSLQDNIRKLL